MFDVIIIGGGPAGLTSAIYTARAGISTLVLEKAYLGGQAALTYQIDNYPGFKNISGMELAAEFEEHVRAVGAKIVMEEVLNLELSKEHKTVTTASNQYEGKCIILALGSERNKLNIPGEKKLSGRGVSYCATCDGNFFKSRNVAVVGGGNTAVGYAVELAKICRHVTVIHRSAELTAMYSLKSQLRDLSNITVLYNHEVEQILGTNKVDNLKIKDIKTNVSETLAVDGVFIAIGMKPNSTIINGQVILSNGFVKTAENGVTSIPGVFVAGDLRVKVLHQIVTAISDGANAAYSAQLYLQDQMK